MTKERRDILSKILQRIREKQPTITETIALEVEAEIRQEYAGTEAYIKKNKVAERKKNLKRTFDGTNALHVTQQLGVSRATFYRTLKSR